jgi:ABC-type Fe3+-citrate transport system substrate-binding protein
MKYLAPLLLLLAACGAQPAPEFLHAKRVDITQDGRQYTVYHTEKRVEVIRLGYASRGEHQAIRTTMIALIPQVTGCKLLERSLQGDSGEMRGSIRC